MSHELDKWGFPVAEAERMQRTMLSLHDLLDEAEMAGFPKTLIAELRQLRLKFIDEFERRHPGYGTGRAVWR